MLTIKKKIPVWKLFWKVVEIKKQFINYQTTIFRSNFFVLFKGLKIEIMWYLEIKHSVMQAKAIAHIVLISDTFVLIVTDGYVCVVGA